jgi:hypothetical protein
VKNQPRARPGRRNRLPHLAFCTRICKTGWAGGFAWRFRLPSDFFTASNLDFIQLLRPGIGLNLRPIRRFRGFFHVCPTGQYAKNAGVGATYITAFATCKTSFTSCKPAPLQRYMRRNVDQRGAWPINSQADRSSDDAILMSLS